MNLLERIRLLRGAEDALGLTFTARDRMDAHLPQGSRLLGYSETLYFCFVEGYAGTVFAVEDQPGEAWRTWPVAYSFEEFLRLVFACGCAELAARAGRMSEPDFRRQQDRFLRFVNEDLIRLRRTVDLQPVADPYHYVRTVGRILDTSRLQPH